MTTEPCLPAGTENTSETSRKANDGPAPTRAPQSISDARPTKTRNPYVESMEWLNDTRYTP